MSVLKTLAALAAVFVVTFCNSHSYAEDRYADFKALLPPGTVDVEITAEQSVVGRFAGFFTLRIQTFRQESDDVADSQSDDGTLALTFDSFRSQPADRPTNLSGLVVVGNQKFPSKIELIASPRGDDPHAFNVNLTGLTETELVGVATVDPDSITMRLHDNTPHRVAVILRQQPQTANPKPSLGAAVQSDAGGAGVNYAEGQHP